MRIRLLTWALAFWVACAAAAPLRAEAQASELFPESGVSESSLRDYTRAVVRSIKKTGVRQGSESFLFQMQQAGKCDQWVEYARPYLERLWSEDHLWISFYSSIVSWNGQGGLHNLYFGFVADPSERSVRLFVFDPWQANVKSQFYWLDQANDWSTYRQYRTHGVLVAWDPISKTLYAPEGVKLDGFKLEPNSEIGVETKISRRNGRVFQRLPVKEQIRRGASVLSR